MTVSPVAGSAPPPTITVVTTSLASLRANVLSAVAGTINTSVADLQGRLRAGQSISDVARAAGLSRPDLLATVSAALTATGGLVADLPQDRVVQRLADHRQKVPRTATGRDETAERSPADTIGQHLDLRL